MTVDIEITQRRTEEKRRRFCKIAENRTNYILDALRLLGNCANKANYEYTEEQVQAMFTAIEEALRVTKQKYAQAQEPKKFRFRED